MANDELKQRDIKPCGLCGKGVMHANNITLYRVTHQQFILNVENIKRTHGHELMIGNAAIAAIMGPDLSIAEAPVPPTSTIICQPCMFSKTLVDLFFGGDDDGNS